MKLAKSCCFVFSVLMGLPLFAGLVYANKAHQMLSDQTNSERNETLTALLTKSKQDCDVVVRNFFQGLEPEGGGLWNVMCDNGNSYILLIENDDLGSTRIMDCALMNSMTKGKGKCFKKVK